MFENIETDTPSVSYNLYGVKVLQVTRLEHELVILSPTIVELVLNQTEQVKP
jgi:hypothetical protein